MLSVKQETDNTYFVVCNDSTVKVVSLTPSEGLAVKVVQVFQTDDGDYSFFMHATEKYVS